MIGQSPAPSDCLAPHLSPLTGYQRYGCRCARCKAARYAYTAEFKKRTRQENARWAEGDREASRAWKDRNRERNRARDRVYRQGSGHPALDGEPAPVHREEGKADG